MLRGELDIVEEEEVTKQVGLQLLTNIMVKWGAGDKWLE